MCNVRRGMERCLGVIVLLLPLVIIQASLLGGEMDKKPKEALKAKMDFILTTKEGFLSLRAKDASLKKILEEIGHRMKIEVVGNISQEERITIAFDKLSLEDAIKSLSKNYAFVKESGKEKERIMKITILSEGRSREELPQQAQKETAPAPEETAKEKPTRPKPFKFEFDPSEFEEDK